MSPDSLLLCVSIDPVTGGPDVRRQEAGPEMSDEEKEREAGKLVEMLKKLNE